MIYVNDNYGDFTADFDDVVSAALDGERSDLVSPIAPDDDSLRVLKVRHSAFYASSLAYLLRRLETERLIITGQVTEQCILYSALDAYVRHFSFIVPPDCVASIDPEARRCRADHDGQEHARRAGARGEVPALTPSSTVCWLAVRSHAPQRIRRFSLRRAS